MKWFRWIWLAGTLALLGEAFYQAMYVAPTEATMGNIQRIFYYHFPSAMMTFLFFFISFIASIVYLAFRHRDPLRAMSADALALAAAEIGVVFCTAVLIQGPLWARPVWGIWWTWDARLTLTFTMWLIYISYLVLRRFSTSSQTALLAAVLAIFGGLVVPLNYMAIRWWVGQHPSPVIGGGGYLDPRMAHVLLINWAAFLCLAWLVSWTRYRLEVLKREVEEAQALESLHEVSR
jgi:heme exporter protein C